MKRFPKDDDRLVDQKVNISLRNRQLHSFLGKLKKVSSKRFFIQKCDLDELSSKISKVLVHAKEKFCM